MNLSTPVRHNPRPRADLMRIDQRGAPPHRGAHLSATGCESRTMMRVAPVVFLEPGPDRSTPAFHHRQANHDDDTLHRLRNPFTPDEPGHR